MDKNVRLALKEKHIYKAIFDSVAPSSNNPTDNYYNEVIIYSGGDVHGYDTDEVIYYDGGGVEGYGN